MNSRTVSWEIVLAGLAFIGIAIYLLNKDDVSHSGSSWSSAPPERPTPPAEAPLPPTIVIDLQNLKNLKNLQNLENLENLKNLEFEFKNLDKIIREHTAAIEESANTSVEQSLQKIEQSLQSMENSDFNVRLQDRKIFINRNFNVDEAAWSEVSSGVFVYRESFDLSRARAVDLNLGFGNINVIGGDDLKGELVLQATGDVESPEELQKKLEMMIDIGAEKASFDISSGERFNFSDRINLEATLTLPAEVNANIKTLGGHITANHLRGNQMLATSGGHITLDDLTGTSTAKTNGGHITGERIEGDISLSTAGGHIRINRVNGTLDLSTGGGHIEVREWAGGGQAKTNGGNISASLTSAEGPVSLNSSAGNISILLPTSVNADIELRGTETSIDGAFDFSGTKSEGKLTGTINGGGIPITANCGYGNIAIKAND